MSNKYLQILHKNIDNNFLTNYELFTQPKKWNIQIIKLS